MSLEHVPQSRGPYLTLFNLLQDFQFSYGRLYKAYPKRTAPGDRRCQFPKMIKLQHYSGTAPLAILKTTKNRSHSFSDPTGWHGLTVAIAVRVSRNGNANWAQISPLLSFFHDGGSCDAYPRRLARFAQRCRRGALIDSGGFAGRGRSDRLARLYADELPFPLTTRFPSRLLSERSPFPTA